MRSLEWQRCSSCGTFQYPERELCRHCLCDTFVKSPVRGEGTILAATNIYHSLDSHFSQHLPWYAAKVKMIFGVSIIAHAKRGLQAGDKVIIQQLEDHLHRKVFVALPIDCREQFQTVDQALGEYPSEWDQ